MARWRAPCSDFEPADRTGFSRQHHIGEQCGAKKASCRGKPWSGFPARLLHVLQECYFWLWMGATWRATPKVDFWTTENAHMDTSLVACWGRLRSSPQMLWAHRPLGWKLLISPWPIFIFSCSQSIYSYPEMGLFGEEALCSTSIPGISHNLALLLNTPPKYTSVTGWPSIPLHFIHPCLAL